MVIPLQEDIMSKRFWVSILATMVVTMFAVTAALSDQPAAAKQQDKHFEKEITVKGKLDYLLYLPEGYDKEEKALPLVAVLHGAGESGPDLNQANIHGPPNLIDAHQ